MNVLLIIIGVLVVLSGMLFEKFRPGALGTSSGPEIPKWVGRLAFIAFGIWCIYLGLHSK